VEYSTVELEGKKATVCRVKVTEEKLELFLRDDSGHPLRSFAGVNRYLEPKGRQLAWAMNAGMYHGDLNPVGLFANDGRQINPLNLEKGIGNFFVKPNGVFLITVHGAARVVESSECLQLNDKVRLATQSGPLLVRRRVIHPTFKPDSTSRLVRNGVGVPSPDVALFVITRDPMNIHEFARLFRDVLHCPDALYFDGTVSSLYAPELGRRDRLIDLGPIIGITAEK
jgi:uncharacterized protein YigE (DUF2233 family)